MFDGLEGFSEPTREWFAGAFGAPTQAQAQAWPAIQRRDDVLVIAPTGSGKTLAAFLAAIDRLLAAKAQTAGTVQADGNARAKRGRRRNKGVKVLYISPLKALGVDVAKNLETPLAGIGAQYEADGLQAPEIRIAMRSGDTSAQERAAIARNPPDILVTTPESLYLMLTSKARDVLKTVDTVIIDEVHAVAPSKRGAHLALSLERLDALLEAKAQRIGLSATVNPVDQIAKFLGGPHDVTVVNAAAPPHLKLEVVDAAGRMPDGGRLKSPCAADAAAPRISGVTPAMRRAAERREGSAGSQEGGNAPGPGLPPAPTAARGEQKTFSIWPQVQASVLDQILAHRTTLVFVNSRGVAERLTAQINDLYAQRMHPEREFEAWGQKGDGPDEPAHRRSSYGSTSMLVGSPDPDDVIAMAHHGSVSKDRRKQIEDDLKRGKLRCVVATSSLELGIDMGSVDLVIQIAPPLSVSSGLQRVGRADHKVGGTSHALIYPLTRRELTEAGAAVEAMNAGALEPMHMTANALDVLAQHTVAAASIEPINADEWFALVRRAAPYATLPRELFDGVVGMLTGAYASEDFSAFKPPLMLDADSGMISPRPGAQRLAVTSGGTIPDRGMYTVVLPQADGGKGPRRVGELDEEMVYETRVGDIITLGTSTWQVQEITNDRVIVIPAPGRSARLPFWHGDQAGRSFAFGQAQGQWIGDMTAALGDETPFNEETMERLKRDGFDGGAIENLAQFLSQQQAATGNVPDGAHIVVERTQDEESDWTVLVHSPYGRQVHEPWALAINARLQQRYGFSGQIFAADNGIVIKLPDGDGAIDIPSIIRFDADEAARIVAEQVGSSVLFASRFREVAARSLYMPRMNPGKRVPLWQQRLRASQLLAAARPIPNFPLIVETTRECLQDVYDLPSFRTLMERINAGLIAVSDVTTPFPSPMAEQLMFGFVGSVMYNDDTPLAERNSQLLSLDPAVLEQLLGSSDYASVLSEAAIDDVAAALADRTFWNELDERDVTGRVNRYAKTHGPFIASTMIDECGFDAETAVRALDELKARGELMSGRFDGRLPDGVGQWVHRDVFQRIRAQSLRAARKAIRPVTPADYQRFLLGLQGVGAVGAERYEGADGLLRVIEQLEGVALPLRAWEESVFPARVRDYAPALLDELVMSGAVVWVGDADGKTAFYPSDSLQLERLSASMAPGPARPADAGGEPNGGMTLEQAIEHVLAGGGAYPAPQLMELAKAYWAQHAEPYVDDATGELVLPDVTSQGFAAALWNLVEQGKLTNSTVAVMRARQAGAAAKGRQGAAHSKALQPRGIGRSLTRRRMHARTALPPSMGGLWRHVSAAMSGSEAASVAPEQYRIDEVEGLLDRYGVVAPPIVEQAGIAGGFSAIYPVLKRMEDKGLLIRGMFVEGFGAAQFATRDTVDALRAVPATSSAASVTLSAIDPAVIYGGAASWPPVASAGADGGQSGRTAPKPVRREGSFVALRDGVPVLFANTKGRKLMAFTDVESLLGSACHELAYTLQRDHGAPVAFAEANGEALTQRSPLFFALRGAGFTPTPQGLKLYR